MRMSISCCKQIFDLLNKLKNKTGISKSKIIELAVREWAKNRGLYSG